MKIRALLLLVAVVALALAFAVVAQRRRAERIARDQAIELDRSQQRELFRPPPYRAIPGRTDS
jgi:hypothetical protein